MISGHVRVSVGAANAVVPSSLNTRHLSVSKRRPNGNA